MAGDDSRTGEGTARNVTGVAPTGPMSLSAAESAAQQLWEAHGAPELDRRIAAGLRAPGEPVTTWQILVFPDGRKPIVRLEDEVRGVAMVTASRDVDSGEDVLDSEVTGLSDFLLLDGDHDDAGHLTVLQIAEGQAIAFDFRYHSAHAAGLTARAPEFLYAAEAALNAGHLNAFAENAYTAGELVAKAELIVSLDTDLAAAKTHKRVLSSYNQQLKLANTSQDAAKVLNRLASLRKTARYGLGQSGLTEPEAREMLVVLHAFLERVESRRPRRATRDSV